MRVGGVCRSARTDTGVGVVCGCNRAKRVESGRGSEGSAVAGQVTPGRAGPAWCGVLAGVRTRRDIDQAGGRRSQEGHGRAGPRCAGPLLMLVVPPGSGTLSPTPGTASAFEGPPRPALSMTSPWPAHRRP